MTMDAFSLKIKDESSSVFLNLKFVVTAIGLIYNFFILI